MLRLYLSTTPNARTVPFNNQNLLLSIVHKWLGKNKIHDKISLYSFSWLRYGQAHASGLEFSGGSKWFISFFDEEIAKQCINGIRQDPNMFHGLRVSQIQLQRPPHFSKQETFPVASPVFIKKWDGNTTKHLTWRDKKAGEAMTQTLSTKLREAGLDFEVSVDFDSNYKNPKTQLVTINNIKNRASMCPVVITGNPQAIQFAWAVGVGHSTGCGFGALK